MFGTISELLKYKYNQDYSIFDLKDRMHSFQDTMFQFFSLIYLADKDLNDTELK